MDWQALLADVEAQAESWAERDRHLMAADHTRLEMRAVPTSQRFAGSMGSMVWCLISPDDTVSGYVDAVGKDWVLLTDSHSRAETLIALDHVVAVRGLADQARALSTSAIVDSLDVMWALQRISRERSRVRLNLVGGTVTSGIINRVGADHVLITGSQEQLVQAKAITHIARL